MNQVQIPLRGSRDDVFRVGDVQKTHKTFSRWIQLHKHRTGIELINGVVHTDQGGDGRWGYGYLGYFQVLPIMTFGGGQNEISPNGAFIKNLESHIRVRTSLVLFMSPEIRRV